MTAAPVALVIDTNIALDIWVFHDPAAQFLADQLQCGELRWIATRPMRDELERVLAYPHIARRLQDNRQIAADVLGQFDATVQWMDVAPRADAICKDPDDQKFIDLAVAQRAPVLSKDKAVLCLAKRLLTLGARALPAWQPPDGVTL